MMEAEDTVKVCGDEHCQLYCHERQAELSFKAGQIQGLADAVEPGIKAVAKSIADGIDIGRREVVEWLHKHPRIIDELRDVLPDQLKEWGI